VRLRAVRVRLLSVRLLSSELRVGCLRRRPRKEARWRTGGDEERRGEERRLGYLLLSLLGFGTWEVGRERGECVVLGG
jgi:hypothetical protein